MARPVGSFDGIAPKGGYPVLSDADGHFLAGFVEGEGCFSIHRSAGGYQCALHIAARRDDRELLEELCSITRLGRLTDRLPQRNSAPQSVWTISRKADCLRLVEITEAFPLRGRKMLQRHLWSAAVRFWCQGDATQRHTNRDWTPLAYLANRLRSSRRYSRRLGWQIEPGLPLNKHRYLAGLLTAEGHLSLHEISGGRIRAAMVIRMRGDELPLLQEMRHLTDAGRIYHYQEPGANPVAVWSVNSHRDRTKVVALFDASPPRGRKGLEYEIWREAALESSARAPNLAALRQELAAVRSYQES